MIEIWGVTQADAKGAPQQVDGRPDAHLLNGPQKTGEGVAQDDIDRLLQGDGATAPTPAPATTSSQNDIDNLFK
jgi:hypothetical protein